MDINVRENRKGNQEWTIQRHCQHGVYDTQDEDRQSTKSQHNTENQKDEQHGLHQKPGMNPGAHEG